MSALPDCGEAGRVGERAGLQRHLAVAASGPESVPSTVNGRSVGDGVGHRHDRHRQRDLRGREGDRVGGRGARHDEAVVVGGEGLQARDRLADVHLGGRRGERLNRRGQAEFARRAVLEEVGPALAVVGDGAVQDRRGVAHARGGVGVRLWRRRQARLWRQPGTTAAAGRRRSRLLGARADHLGREYPTGVRFKPPTPPAARGGAGPVACSSR